MTVSIDGYKYLDEIISQEEAIFIHDEYLRISDSIKHNTNLDLRNRKYLKFTSNKDIRLLENPISISSKLDAIFEKILSNFEIRNSLTNIFKNRNYKLWTVYIRDSLPGSEPLVMHQDKENSIVLTFAINGCEGKNGTTVFIPKTHKFPILLNKLRANISPRLFPSFARSKYFIGDPGKAMIYSGELWHARTENNSKKNNIILSFSFLDSHGLENNFLSNNILIDNEKFPNLYKNINEEDKVTEKHLGDKIFKKSFFSISGLINFFHLTVVFFCVILLHLIKLIIPINIIK